MNVSWLRVREAVRKQAFVRDAGALTVASFFTAAVSFFQGIVVARWLGPEAYGIAALVTAYPALAFGIFDARASAMAVKFLGECCARGESKRALAVCKLGYLTDFAVSLLSFLAILATATWAGSFLVKRPGTQWLMMVYAAGFLPQSLSGTSSSVLSVLGRFPRLALVRISMAALRAGLIIAFVVSGWGVAGVIWGHALGMAVSGFSLAAVAYPLGRKTWGGSWLRASWGELRGKGREIFRFLVYADLGELLGIIPKQLDVLVLGYLRGPQEAGYYKLALHLAAAAGYIAGPLQSAIYPRFARMAGGGPRRQLRAAARRAFFRIGAPLGILSLAGIPLLPWLVGLLFGKAYLPATPVAQILLVGQSLALGLFWVRPFYLAIGSVFFLFHLRLVNAGLALLLYPLSAALWGSSGMGVARVVAGQVRYAPAAVAVLRARERRGE